MIKSDLTDKIALKEKVVRHKNNFILPQNRGIPQANDDKWQKINNLEEYQSKELWLKRIKVSQSNLTPVKFNF